MNNKSSQDNIRKFFEADAQKYMQDRYPSKAGTCAQQSYLTRKKYVFEFLDTCKHESNRILDVGCGPGPYITELLDLNYEIHGIDISSNMLERARDVAHMHPMGKNAHFNIGDPVALDFDDSSFGTVISIGVISYISDIYAAMSEMYRVLKPGGCVILQISNKSSPYEIESKLKNKAKKLIRGQDHNDDEHGFTMRPYSLKTIKSICESAGFTYDSHRYYDFYVTSLARFYPKLMLSLSLKLDALSESRLLGWLGASCIIKLRKIG